MKQNISGSKINKMAKWLNNLKRELQLKKKKRSVSEIDLELRKKVVNWKTTREEIILAQNNRM